MAWRIVVLALGLGATSPSARAQATRPSQEGTVMQRVGRTRVDIRYRRPTARGRELFGLLVPWGQLWTPSADSAATIAFSTAVDVNDQHLPAGTYGLWAIPDSVAWTVVFSTVSAAHHTRYPEGRDALRVPAPVRHGEQVETLAFYFPLVDADSAVLNLHWGRTVVPLRIRSRP